MVRLIQKAGQGALVGIGLLVLWLGFFATPASAITPLPNPEPKPGSFGVEATKPQPAPTTGATISTPGNGSSFTKSVITVSGICPKGLLVEVFDNGVMVGAVMCDNGSFSVQVSLFAGVNELTAMVYDNLDQTGPVSNTVKVTYNDTNFTSFGQLVTLTSSYGRRSAPAGNALTWPLQLNGGTGPYAFSIDWGDGSKLELKSQSLAGSVNIAHVYSKAGIYHLNITVTDSNGVSAFLQLVAVASGQVDTASTTGTDKKSTGNTVKVLWWPTAILFALLVPTYWLGRRSQLVSIRSKMLRERDDYEKRS